MFRPQQHSVHRISDEDPAQQALQAFLKWSSQEAWLNSTPIILSYVAITCHVVFELDAYPFINYTYNESCTGWIVRWVQEGVAAWIIDSQSIGPVPAGPAGPAPTPPLLLGLKHYQITSSHTCKSDVAVQHTWILTSIGHLLRASYKYCVGTSSHAMYSDIAVLHAWILNLKGMEATS